MLRVMDKSPRRGMQFALEKSTLAEGMCRVTLSHLTMLFVVEGPEGSTCCSVISNEWPGWPTIVMEGSWLLCLAKTPPEGGHASNRGTGVLTLQLTDQRRGERRTLPRLGVVAYGAFQLRAGGTTGRLEVTSPCLGGEGGSRV